MIHDFGEGPSYKIGGRQVLIFYFLLKIKLLKKIIFGPGHLGPSLISTLTRTNTCTTIE